MAAAFSNLRRPQRPQPRIAHHIGHEDCGEAAYGTGLREVARRAAVVANAAVEETRVGHLAPFSPMSGITDMRSRSVSHNPIIGPGYSQAAAIADREKPVSCVQLLSVDRSRPLSAENPSTCGRTPSSTPPRATPKWPPTSFSKSERARPTDAARPKGIAAAPT